MIVLTMANDGRKAYVDPEKICAIFPDNTEDEQTIVILSGSAANRIFVSESAEEVYNLIKEQKYPKYANGAFEERAQK